MLRLSKLQGKSPQFAVERGWIPLSPLPLTLFIKPTKGSFLTGAQDSHLQRVTIPEATYIQLRRRPPEDEQGNARNM